MLPHCLASHFLHVYNLRREPILNLNFPAKFQPLRVQTTLPHLRHAAPTNERMNIPSKCASSISLLKRI